MPRRFASSGFTLVEMMVVIVIASVLMAIGMAVFKPSTSKARQAAAISNLQAAASSATERAAETSSFPDPNTVKGNLAYDEPQLDPQTGSAWAEALLPAYKNSVVLINSGLASNPAGLTMYSRTTTGDVVEMVVGPKGEQKASLIKDLIGKTPALVSKPSVSGSLVVGQQVTANPGGWLSDITPTFTYQWQRCDHNGNNCVDIPGIPGTSRTYTITRTDAADDGTATNHNFTLVVKVRAGNTAGLSASSAASPLPSNEVTLNNATTVPQNTAQPVISGTPKQGVVTAASAGTWNNNPSAFDYQWYRCDASGNNCVIIAGASGTNIPSSPAPTFNYTPAVADVASTLRIQVVGKDALGDSSMAQSNASPLVQGAAPVNTSQPTLVGSAAEGQTISTTNGVWSNSPTSYSYQWQRCLNGVCSDISGAVASSYLATSSDFNNQLKAKVTANNAYGSTVTTTDPSAPVAGVAPVNNTLPTITGTVKDGQSVTINNGTWTGTAPITYTYQWQISPNNSTWSDLGGQTASTYAIPYNTYTSQYLRTRVTASNAVGTTVTYTSGYQISPASPVNTAVPTVSGTAQDGQTLTATNGSWSGTATVTYNYQWQYSNDGSTGWTSLAGATSNTYTITPTQVTKYIRVQVTGTNSAGSANAYSTSTSQVTSIPVSNSAPPSFTGTAQDGSTLTASPGTWSGTPTIGYAYQWQRSANGTTGWANIASATSQTYVLTSSDYANYVRVQVVGSNAYTNATAYSSASSQVTALAPTNTGVPTISGTPQDGQALTTTNGSWSGTPTITYSYQWQSSANGSTGWANIGGATSSSYTIISAYVGQYLRSCVSASNAGGSSSSCSASSAQVVDSVPVGAVVAFSGGSIPSGWLLADGSAVSRAAYSSLFSTLGSTYGGGDGSTTFNLPNLQGRFPLGKAASGTGSALGGSGGSLDSSGSVSVASLTYNFSWTDSAPNPAFSAGSFSWTAHHTQYVSDYPWIGTHTTITPVTFSTTESGSVSSAAVSSSGSANVTASYSALNAPYQSLFYIVKASTTAATPACAVIMSGASSFSDGSVAADGSAASGAQAACLSASFSSASPDLRGRFALGKASSGTGSSLAGTGGSLSQSASVSLDQASTVASVSIPSHSLSMTISSPAPSSLSYSSPQTQYGGNDWNGGTDAEAPFGSVGSQTGGSDDGSVISSSAYGGSVSSSTAPAQTVSSTSYSAPFIALNPRTNMSSMSAGYLLAYGGSGTPSGWLQADGGCYATGSYPSLFAAISYTYGGAAGTFCVPDLRGRMALGKASSGTGSSLGATGGSITSSPTATLASWTPQMTVPSHVFSWGVPSHYHNLTGALNGTNRDYCDAACYGGNNNVAIALREYGGYTWASSYGGGQTVSSTASSQTLNAAATGALGVTLPAQTSPYQVFNYLIKY